jgi:hypothetical protein
VTRRSTLRVAAAVALLLLGVGAPVGYVMVDQGLDLQEVLAYVFAVAEGAAELDDADIAAALAPWAAFSDPDAPADSPQRGTNGRGGVLRRPVATLVLGWEGTLVDVTYHPRSGWIAVPRPGLDKLLLACAENLVEVVVWSREHGVGSVQDQVHHVVKDLVVPQDRDRYEAFQAYLDANYKAAVGMEVARAAEEGRRARPLEPISRDERPELYAKSVLRIAAVLGKEHCVAKGSGGAGVTAEAVKAEAEAGAEGGAGAPPPSPSKSSPSISAALTTAHGSLLRPYQALAQMRPPGSLLVVDADESVKRDAAEYAASVVAGGEEEGEGWGAAAATSPVAALYSPENVMVIAPWKAPPAADSGGPGAPRRDGDPTLLLVAELVERFALWDGARREGWRRRQRDGEGAAAAAAAAAVDVVAAADTEAVRPRATSVSASVDGGVGGGPGDAQVPSSAPGGGLRAFYGELVARGTKMGMRPKLGKAVDDTVAALGVLLRDYERRQAAGGHGKAS